MIAQNVVKSELFRVPITSTTEDDIAERVATFEKLLRMVKEKEENIEPLISVSTKEQAQFIASYAQIVSKVLLELKTENLDEDN